MKKSWMAPGSIKNEATIGNTWFKNRNWKGHFINEMYWLPEKNYLLRRGQSTSPGKVKKTDKLWKEGLKIKHRMNESCSLGQVLTNILEQNIFEKYSWRKKKLFSHSKNVANIKCCCNIA